jgi:hypothetical protein
MTVGISHARTTEHLTNGNNAVVTLHAASQKHRRTPGHASEPRTLLFQSGPRLVLVLDAGDFVVSFSSCACHAASRCSDHEAITTTNENVGTTKPQKTMD